MSARSCWLHIRCYRFFFLLSRTRLSSIHYHRSTTIYPLSTIHYHLSTIHYSLFTIIDPLPYIHYHISTTIYHLWLHVYPQKLLVSTLTLPSPPNPTAKYSEWYKVVTRAWLYNKSVLFLSSLGISTSFVGTLTFFFVLFFPSQETLISLSLKWVVQLNKSKEFELNLSRS